MLCGRLHAWGRRELSIKYTLSNACNLRLRSHKPLYRLRIRTKSAAREVFSSIKFLGIPARSIQYQRLGTVSTTERRHSAAEVPPYLYSGLGATVTLHTAVYVGTLPRPRRLSPSLSPTVYGAYLENRAL